MSRTYKTRPGWLVEWADGTVEHDHRHGPCRPESLAVARDAARGADRHHWQVCPRYRPVGDGEQARRGYDPELPCGVCDGLAARPTCRPRLQRGFAHTQRIYGAGVPGWFVNHVYHAPMRRSARDTLHRAAGEWNAGYRPGDDNVEDRWEPPVLYARSAAWLWW